MAAVPTFDLDDDDFGTSEADAATLERIRKLLAMAERGATEEERDAFSRKAETLIAQYGIEKAMLSAAATPGVAAETVTDRRLDIPGPYSIDKASLLNTIALVLGCKVIRLSGRGATTTVRIFGFASDLDRTTVLYHSLVPQAMMSLGAAVSRQHHSTNITGFKKSFLAGFATKIKERLRESEARARGEAQSPGGPSVALVLQDRAVQVASAFRAAYPRTTTSRRSVRDYSGYGAGTAAGAAAGMGGGGQIGGSRRAIGGR